MISCVLTWNYIFSDNVLQLFLLSVRLCMCTHYVSLGLHLCSLFSLVIEEEEEDFAQSNDHCMRAHPPFQHLELARVKPNKASIPPVLARWRAQLSASAFNQLGQYASSPGYRVHCHAEHAISSLVVSRRPSQILILPTHRGIARLSWPGWLVRQR